MYQLLADNRELDTTD